MHHSAAHTTLGNRRTVPQRGAKPDVTNSNRSTAERLNWAVGGPKQPCLIQNWPHAGRISNKGAA